MMRLLVAILLSMAFLAMEPGAGASAPAMPSGLAMAHTAIPFIADACANRCMGGYPCLPGCWGCPLAPDSTAGQELPIVPATDQSTLDFADFDLSWRLYRPPKSWARRRHY